jgi:hypothetical protein
MANQLAGKPDFLGSRRDGSEDRTHAAAGNEEDRPGELGSGGSEEGEGGGGVQCGVNLGRHGEAILRWSVRESSEFYCIGQSGVGMAQNGQNRAHLTDIFKENMQ